MKMFKLLFSYFIIIFMLGNVEAFAQKESYEYWYNRAEKSFKQGKFEDAVNEYRVAQICDDAPELNDIDEKLEASYRGYVNKLNSIVAELKLQQQEAEANRRLGLAFREKDNDLTAAWNLTRLAYEIAPQNKQVINELGDLIEQGGFYQHKIKYQTLIEDIELSNDGEYLLIEGKDGENSLRRTNGKEVLSFKATGQAKMHPVESYFAYVSESQVVTFVDFEGKRLRELNIPSRSIRNIDFSSDGNWLITADVHGTVQLNDLQGKLVKKRSLNSRLIYDLEVSPTAKWIASFGAGGNLVLWDYEADTTFVIPNNDQFQRYRPAKLSFSKDGTLLAITAENNDLLIWNLVKKEFVNLGNIELKIPAFCFGDGNNAYTGYENGLIFEIINIFRPNINFNDFKGHNSQVDFLTYNNQKKVLVSAGIDGSVRIWYPALDRDYLVPWNGKNTVSGFVPNKQELWTLQNRTLKNWDFEGQLQGAKTFALHPATISTEDIVLRGNHKIAFLRHILRNRPIRNSRIADSSNKASIRIYDFRSNTEQVILAPWQLSQVYLSPDDRYIYAAELNQRVHQYDLRKNERVRIIDSIGIFIIHIAASNDHDRLLLASEKELRLLDNLGEILAEVRIPTGETILGLGFIPRSLARELGMSTEKWERDIPIYFSKRTMDDSLRLRSLDQSLEKTFPLVNHPPTLDDENDSMNMPSDSSSAVPANQGVPSRYRRFYLKKNTLKYHPDKGVVSFIGSSRPSPEELWIYSLKGTLPYRRQIGHISLVDYDFSDNLSFATKSNKLLVEQGHLLSQSYQGTSFLTELASGKVISLGGPIHKISAQEMLPDKQGFLIGDNIGNIHQFDLNGVLKQSYPSPNSKSLIQDIILNEQGDKFLSIPFRKYVHLWDIKGNLLHSQESDKASFTCATFIPESKLIASGSHDGKIALWDENGRIYRLITAHDTAVVGLIPSRDGKTIYSAGYDRKVKIWDVESGLAKREIQLDFVPIAFDLNEKGEKLLLINSERQVHLLNFRGGSIFHVDGKRSGYVSAVFGKDDQFIYVLSGKLYCYDMEGNTVFEKYLYATEIELSREGDQLSYISNDQTFGLSNTFHGYLNHQIYQLNGLELKNYNWPITYDSLLQKASPDELKSYAFSLKSEAKSSNQSLRLREEKLAWSRIFWEAYWETEGSQGKQELLDQTYASYLNLFFELEAYDRVVDIADSWVIPEEMLNTEVLMNTLLSLQLSEEGAKAMGLLDESWDLLEDPLALMDEYLATSADLRPERLGETVNLFQRIFNRIISSQDVEQLIETREMLNRSDRRRRRISPTLRIGDKIRRIESILGRRMEELEQHESPSVLWYVANNYISRIEEAQSTEELELSVEKLKLIVAKATAKAQSRGELNRNALGSLRYNRKLQPHQRYYEQIKAELDIIRLERVIALGDPGSVSDLSQEYSDLAFYKMFAGEFKESLALSQKALATDSSTQIAYTNLVLGYLFTGKFKEAAAIYRSKVGKSFLTLGNSERKFVDSFQGDLDLLEQAGITHPDVSKARKLIADLLQSGKKEEEEDSGGWFRWLKRGNSDIEN